MLKDIVQVQSRGGYRLWLRFEDGVEGELDFEPLLSFEGIFAALRDPSYFAQAEAHPDLGTLAWPNGADWDPLVLYSLITGRPVEELLAETSSV